MNLALKIFELRPYHVNELARTTFAKARLLQSMGKAVEADDLLAKAYAIRKRLRPHDHRPIGILGSQDFDELVAFWSR